MMAENSVGKTDREKEMAASRLRSVADLANSNALLASHLRAAADCIHDETYLSNGMVRAIARLSNL